MPHVVKSKLESSSNLSNFFETVVPGSRYYRKIETSPAVLGTSLLSTSFTPISTTVHYSYELSEVHAKSDGDPSKPSGKRKQIDD